MKTERVIEILTEHSKYISEVNFDAIIAYKLAIKTLEKDIPAKVVTIPCIYEHEKSGYCGACGLGDVHTINGHNYCYSCGRKLDWDQS